MSTELGGIRGSEQLIARFGYWPSFHDATVNWLTLDRRGNNGPSMTFVVHTWEITSKIDDRGFYVLDKHTLVQFLFERITSCDLSDFNDGNIISELSFEPEVVEGVTRLRVTFDTSYGLYGSVVFGRAIVVKVTPCDASGQPTQAT